MGVYTWVWGKGIHADRRWDNQEGNQKGRERFREANCSAVLASPALNDFRLRNLNAPSVLDSVASLPFTLSHKVP